MSGAKAGLDQDASSRSKRARIPEKEGAHRGRQKLEFRRIMRAAGFRKREHRTGRNPG